MRAMRILATATVAALLAACGGGGSSGGPDNGPDYGDAAAWTIETTVSAEAVEAGSTVDVTCTVTGPQGPAQAETEVVVTPADGATVAGLKVTFAKAGTYALACSAPAIPAEDATPASVTVSPGRPSTVETAVAPATIPAGNKAAVTCSATDANGNPAVGEFEVTVVPAEGVVVTNQGSGAFQAEGHTAGAYQVACGLKGGAKDASPATLTVEAGALDTVKTVLDADTVKAGDPAKGHCEALDAWGNVIAGIAFTLDSEPSLTITASAVGFEASSTKAGKYRITCSPAEGTAKTVPADLTVQAREVVGIALKLIPEKPAYQLGDQVTVGFDLVDTYGNPVPGGTITDPTVDPTTGITKLDVLKFQFEAEGKYTFSACVTGDPGRCDDVVGWCDGTAPLLVITYPERGATLAGDRRVVVTGTVNESVSQVATVTINGQAVQMGADGSFQYPMQPEQGMNLIDAKATDTFGNEVRSLRSYLYSPNWVPMDQPDPLASAVPNAVKAYLDDKLFWNADTTDAATISALLEMAVADLDLSTLIPNPVTTVSQSIGVDTCGYEVYLDSVTFGAPDVTIKPTFGALDVAIVIPDLNVQLRLIKVDGGFLCPGNQAGEALADKVTVTMKVNLDVDPATHLFRISAGDTALTMDGFDVNIDNWFYNLIVGLLKGTLENLLKDQVQSLLVDNINKLPETLNGALAKPIEFTVPELIPGMTPITLRISLQPQTMVFDPEGGAVDINAAITADHTIDRTILGTIGRASCLSGTPEVFGFDLGNPEKLMAALMHDALNEALYSLWGGRLLNLHITSETLADLADLSQYGVANLDATTAALLPPVLTSCNPTGTLTAQVGDLYLDAAMNLMGEDVHFGAFLFLEIEVTLGLADDPEKGRVIAITIGSPPKLVDMDFQMFESAYYSQEEIRSLLVDTMLPVLFDQLAGKPITFAIPTFNLAGLLGAGSPVSLPNKDLAIVPKVLGNTNGYLHFAAGMELRDPVVVTP
jgi:hypothetical protein